MHLLKHRLEILEILKSGNELTLARFAGNILDSVADRHHRVGIHHVMQVAIGNGNEIAEPHFVRSPVMHGHGLGTPLEVMMIGLELGAKFLRRRLLTIRLG